MEINGGSSASYLACTPCVPLCLYTWFNRSGSRRRVFRLLGVGGDHFHCTVEPSSSDIRRHPSFGNGPNTVSESTISDTELSEFFALTEFRAENSVSSSQLIICVLNLANSPSFLQNSSRLPKRLSKFSLQKQCSRNSCLPVSDSPHVWTTASPNDCFTVLLVAHP